VLAIVREPTLVVATIMALFAAGAGDPADARYSGSSTGCSMAA
jgi:hypothetical protein